MHEETTCLIKVDKEIAPLVQYILDEYTYHLEIKYCSPVKKYLIGDHSENFKLSMG